MVPSSSLQHCVCMHHAFSPLHPSTLRIYFSLRFFVFHCRWVEVLQLLRSAFVVLLRTLVHWDSLKAEQSKADGQIRIYLAASSLHHQYIAS
jgi:hypothetical protein